MFYSVHPGNLCWLITPYFTKFPTYNQIPVIIGATGTISKSCRKYVSTIPGNHEVREVQKTALLGTAHILRKVLM
jgi:hypothetical protein